RRTEYDLVDLNAVFARLHANRVRTRRRKTDDGRLTEPVCVILPAPAREAASRAGLEVDEQSVGRPDAIDGRSGGAGGIVDVNPHRVIPFGTARGAQPQPDVIGRVRRSGKGRLEIVARIGERRIE